MSKKPPFISLGFPGGGPRGAISALNAHELSEAIGAPLMQRVGLVGCFSGGFFPAIPPLLPHPDDPARPRLTYLEIANALMDGAHTIFPRSWQQTARFWDSSLRGNKPVYDKTPLRKAMEPLVGDHVINDIPVPVIISAEDARTKKSLLITNVGNSPTGNIPLKVAGCATTALPKIFEQEVYDLEVAPGILRRLKLNDGITSFGLAQKLLRIGNLLKDPDQEHVIIMLGTSFMPPDIENISRRTIFGATPKVIEMAMHVIAQDAYDAVRDEIGDNLIVLDGDMTEFKRTVLGNEKAEFPSINPTNANPKNIAFYPQIAQWIRESNPNAWQLAVDVLSQQAPPSWLRVQKSLRAQERIALRLQEAATPQELETVYQAIGIMDQPVSTAGVEDIVALVKDLRPQETSRLIAIRGNRRREFAEAAGQALEQAFRQASSISELNRMYGAAFGDTADPAFENLKTLARDLDRDERKRLEALRVPLTAELSEKAFETIDRRARKAETPGELSRIFAVARGEQTDPAHRDLEGLGRDLQYTERLKFNVLEKRILVEVFEERAKAEQAGRRRGNVVPFLSRLLRRSKEETEELVEVAAKTIPAAAPAPTGKTGPV